MFVFSFAHFVILQFYFRFSFSVISWMEDESHLLSEFIVNAPTSEQDCPYIIRKEE